MVQGLRVVDDIVPTITANLMEWNGENFMRALPGLVKVPEATGDTHDVYRIGNVVGGNYVTNVAIVGTALGYGLPFIGLIYNAIGGGEIEISLENKGESVAAVTFTGTFLAADLEALTAGTTTLQEVAPFEIRFPRTAPVPAPAA